MKTKRKHFFLLFYQCLFVMIGFGSCSGESTPPTCTVELTVTGALSGKPRENLHIRVYNSQEDADAKKNRLLSVYTDANGMAILENLTPGKVYWVRAQATFSKSIKSSGTLSAGINWMNMSIL